MAAQVEPAARCPQPTAEFGQTQLEPADLGPTHLGRAAELSTAKTLATVAATSADPRCEHGEQDAHGSVDIYRRPTRHDVSPRLF